MSTELTWLAYTLLMTALLWLPHVVNRILVRGLWGTLKNPVSDEPGLADWALRAKAAHDNAMSNIAIFAPLVLIISQINGSTSLSVLACQIYFWARLIHYVVYTLGIPGIRTVAFLAGWAAQLCLLWVILA